MKNAILFDIDGTLMYAKGLGRLAFAEAFAVAYNQDDAAFDQNISFVGVTDTGVIRGLARDLGIASTPAMEERFFVELTLRLDPKLKQGPLLIYPGVPALLKRLYDEDWLIGTVTGNIRATAWSKLHHAGIDHFFSFGAYGNDAEHRNDIAHIVMNRAHDLNVNVRMLLGDTPSDIEAAHSCGLPALAVCTGWISAEELKHAGADAVIEDFSDTEYTMQVIKDLLSC